MPKGLQDALSFALIRELGGELRLVAEALRHLPILRRPPYRGIFFRFYLLAGVDALGSVVLRAALIGTLIVAYVVNVVAADADIAIHLLQSIVLREIAPTFAALIVMAQAGIETTSRFAHMREHGEIDGLRLLGIAPGPLLAVPGLLGIALATVVLSLYFAVLAVVGGIFIASGLADVTLIELAERFLLHLEFADFAYALLKSALFGLVIGAVACYHGLLAPHSADDRSRLVSRCVMQSLFLISLVQAVTSYIQHGVLLFGILGA